VLRVGLTGGIACGKSHVLRRLAERGCRTLDLDAVARAVTAPGSEALAEIRAAFGDSVLDASGALDRSALGALVFHDTAARQRLNRIVHPRVRAAEAGWAAGFARSEPGAVLVTDGALLIESGVHLRFDRLVVVHCAPELQLRRLRERDGLDEGAARARIESQLPSAMKLAFAHFDVDTSGAPADTERAADALAETLAALARVARGAVPDGVLERFAGGLSHGSDDGPRGLTPSLLLREAASAGGLEMDALARRLTPPAAGLWYRAAEESPAGFPAARLGVAVAAWACARNGSDPEYTAAAAASVARLTHGGAGERTDACLVALAALAGAASAERPGVPSARLLALAARFGTAEPGDRLGAVWAALEQAPADPGRASALCAGLGGDAPTAAALAGLYVEAAAASREPWRSALQAIRASR
jgi:dephospho-CoA kinase